MARSHTSTGEREILTVCFDAFQNDKKFFYQQGQEILFQLVGSSFLVQLFEEFLVSRELLHLPL